MYEVVFFFFSFVNLKLSTGKEREHSSFHSSHLKHRGLLESILLTMGSARQIELNL